MIEGYSFARAPGRAARAMKNSRSRVLVRFEEEEEEEETAAFSSCTARRILPSAAAVLAAQGRIGGVAVEGWIGCRVKRKRNRRGRDGVQRAEWAGEARPRKRRRERRQQRATWTQLGHRTSRRQT